MFNFSRNSFRNCKFAPLLCSTIFLCNSYCSANPGPVRTSFFYSIEGSKFDTKHEQMLIDLANFAVEKKYVMDQCPDTTTNVPMYVVMYHGKYRSVVDPFESVDSCPHAKWRYIGSLNSIDWFGLEKGLYLPSGKISSQYSYSDLYDDEMRCRFMTKINSSFESSGLGRFGDDPMCGTSNDKSLTDQLDTQGKDSCPGESPIYYDAKGENITDSFVGCKLIDNEYKIVQLPEWAPEKMKNTFNTLNNGK